VLRIKSNPELESLVQKFVELKEKEEALKKEKEEIANRIKSFMEECERIEFEHLPYRVCWKSHSSKKFDAKAFKQDHPDLYQSYLTLCESRRFEVK